MFNGFTHKKQTPLFSHPQNKTKKQTKQNKTNKQDWPQEPDYLQDRSPSHPQSPHHSLDPWPPQPAHGPVPAKNRAWSGSSQFQVHGTCQWTKQLLNSHVSLITSGLLNDCSARGWHLVHRTQSTHSLLSLTHSYTYCGTVLGLMWKIMLSVSSSSGP